MTFAVSRHQPCNHQMRTTNTDIWLAADEIIQQFGLRPISPVAQIAARIQIVVLAK